MDQLDFEESNLKSIDLSIAPPLELKGSGKDAQVRIIKELFSASSKFDSFRSYTLQRYFPGPSRSIISKRSLRNEYLSTIKASCFIYSCVPHLLKAPS
jgi:hypothetical protein